MGRVSGWFAGFLATAFLMTIVEEMGLYRSAGSFFEKFIISIVIVSLAKVVSILFKRL